jgi:UDP-glucose 4-epimerase
MHFAGSLSVKESQIKPLKYYNNNVLGTENILNISRSFKIQKFLFSSTCAVYGNTNKLKISELDSTLPISNYGKSKLFAEKLVQEFSKRYNLKFAILRYFNVVGADKKNRSGQISGNTIFKTLCKNLTNKFFQIDIFGDNYPTKDGSCIRDYIDVNDLSELHILCLNKLNKSKSFLLNCGYGKGYSVKEIVYAFSSYIKKKIKINIKNRREGDAEAIYCDTRKLKKIFPKWKGSSNIQDSIKTAMNWEKKL